MSLSAGKNTILCLVKVENLGTIESNFGQVIWDWIIGPGVPHIEDCLDGGIWTSLKVFSVMLGRLFQQCTGWLGVGEPGNREKRPTDTGAIFIWGNKEPTSCGNREKGQIRKILRWVNEKVSCLLNILSPLGFPAILLTSHSCCLFSQCGPLLS